MADYSIHCVTCENKHEAIDLLLEDHRGMTGSDHAQLVQYLDCVITLQNCRDNRAYKCCYLTLTYPTFLHPQTN